MVVYSYIYNCNGIGKRFVNSFNGLDVRKRKNQSQDVSIIENFVSALNIEFEEAKKSNVEKQISLENGERGEQLGSKVLYTFF